MNEKMTLDEAIEMLWLMHISASVSEKEALKVVLDFVGENINE